MDTEIAYLAGFFDGEGFIIICRDKTRLGNPNYKLRIGASQVVGTPIYLLRDRFGGLIQTHNNKNPKHRAIFTWQAHSQKAVAALEEMLPYMTVKKEQALFALSWAKFNKGYQGKKKTEEDIIWLEQQKDILSAMKGYL